MEKRKIKVDDFELRVIVRSLNELRNQLISSKKTTADISAIIFCHVIDLYI